ncbi:MAG: hypothetical protein ACM3L9_10555 [Deltaproteobacteria bacterium]
METLLTTRRRDADSDETGPLARHSFTIKSDPQLSKPADPSARRNNLLMKRLKSARGALVFKGKPASATSARPCGSCRSLQDYLSVLLF